MGPWAAQNPENGGCSLSVILKLEPSPIPFKVGGLMARLWKGELGLAMGPAPIDPEVGVVMFLYFLLLLTLL